MSIIVSGDTMETLYDDMCSCLRRQKHETTTLNIMPAHSRARIGNATEAFTFWRGACATIPSSPELVPLYMKTVRKVEQ